MQVATAASAKSIDDIKKQSTVGTLFSGGDTQI